MSAQPAPDRGATRRDHLKAYLLACVQDNVFSWSDLLSADVLDKLLHAVSNDLKGALGELGRHGASNAARMVGAAFMKVAEGFGKPTGRR